MRAQMRPQSEALQDPETLEILEDLDVNHDDRSFGDRLSEALMAPFRAMRHILAPD